MLIIYLEENNRIGKTRDIVKKIRDIKGTFHAKIGKIKDRSGMDPTEKKILRKGGRIHKRTIQKKTLMI